MVQRNRPTMYARGRFTLRPPWSTVPNMLYKCTSFRSFETCYKEGKDVYKTFYEPMGVLEGSTTYTATPFSLEEERLANVTIVSLRGDDGSLIWVPDSFIASQPVVSDVEYSLMVLAVSLGAIPDDQDLSPLKTSIYNLVRNYTGVNPTIFEARAPSTNTPTPTQHAVLEAARQGAITLDETDKAKAIRLQQEKVLLQNQIDKLTTILRNKGWLPT